MGGILAFISHMIKYTLWKRFVIPAILVSTVLLVWVTVNGTSVKGATRWISIGNRFTIMLSEVISYIILTLSKMNFYSRQRQSQMCEEVLL